MDPQDIKLNRADRRAIAHRVARKDARQRAAQYRKAQRLGVSRDVMLADDAARKKRDEYAAKVAAIKARAGGKGGV